jgi:hypothetical protein
MQQVIPIQRVRQRFNLIPISLKVSQGKERKQYQGRMEKEADMDNGELFTEDVKQHEPGCCVK